MLILSLILLSSQSDFSEVRIENSALTLRVQQSPYVEEFAISNDGKVAFSYDNHINRFRLDANVAKADAEALLFRQIGGKATIRTTSQAAHATNGSSLKGRFQNFLRVDDWSNVWFSYSSTPYEPTPGPRNHIALLQIDRRGKLPNKSWGFPGSVKNAYFGPNGYAYAITTIEHLHYAIVTYKFAGDRMTRISKQEIPKGVVALAYDPSTRRCVAETKDKAVIIHVPSGAKRELPKLGDYPKYTMTRGRVYCQSGPTLYVDDGNRWEVYRPDTLLAASNDGRQWLLYRSGQVFLRTFRD